MTTTYPGSPRFQKGLLASVSPFTLGVNAVVFQYNPATLSRSLEPQVTGEGGNRAEAFRLHRAPIETITLELELDAADPLEARESAAVEMGLHPQIAALELMIAPETTRVILNTVLMAAGTLEVIPPPAPLTLFAWGTRRVVPVLIQSLSVTEENFDVHLNPIRAKVSLGLRVLTYDDLPLLHPGYGIYLANQVLRETMALSARLGSFEALGESLG